MNLASKAALLKYLLLFLLQIFALYSSLKRSAACVWLGEAARCHQESGNTCAGANRQQSRAPRRPEGLAIATSARELVGRAVAACRKLFFAYLKHGGHRRRDDRGRAAIILARFGGGERGTHHVYNHHALAGRAAARAPQRGGGRRPRCSRALLLAGSVLHHDAKSARCRAGCKSMKAKLVAQPLFDPRSRLTCRPRRAAPA